ncbi:hypothetical protein OHW34_17550 [Acinetobacter baumannii]|nr:hypothetical protein [Acinetobacter baumannii]
MIKKSLEEKIRDVVFWTIVFFIIYTIVGFLLETNWLKTAITLCKVNVILKDSLTITAAFLAPVAAFVLFSDWRVEHNEKKREQESEIILIRVNKLLEQLASLFVSVCRDENLNNEKASLEIVKQQFLISLECKALEILTKNSFEEDKEAGKFFETAIDLFKKIEKIGESLKIDEDFFQLHPRYEKNLDRFGNSNTFYLNRLTRQKESIEQLNKDIIQLNIEAKKLRVKT